LIAEKAPWAIAKDATRDAELHDICSLAISWFRLLMGFLKPILPATAVRAEAFLGTPIASFDELAEPMLGQAIAPYDALLTRIDPKQIEAMIEASKESMEAPSQPVATGNAETPASPSPQPLASSPGSISIDDFARLDLRIGTVLECGFIDGSDKLLRFLLDAGVLGQRQIFSGIRAAYPEPEKLIGRKVVFIANLAPRKMRFGVSEGMILSAGGDDGKLFLLDVDSGAQPGMPVK
jgi:methionyl-tRNA synthetase